MTFFFIPTISIAMPNAAAAPPAVLLKNVERAAHNLKHVIYKTPLLQNHGLARLYGATVLLKRDDLQVGAPTRFAGPTTR
jgi:hypothetical protein